MEKEDFREISYEEELQRAKWFKEDLEKGGWSEGLHTPGVSKFWFKTFPDMKVPIKALFTIEIPVPAEKVVEILAPANVKYQREWNAAFPVNELVENYIEQEGGGSLFYSVLELSWPLTNRAYLVFIPPSKEVDWYGKKAFLLLQKNAWHHSKPPGADGFVRATNGGNFSLVIPDEENPSGACKMFMLRNNNYNGCLPNKGIQFLIAKTLPPKFNLWREGIIDAYKRFFSD